MTTNNNLNYQPLQYNTLVGGVNGGIGNVAPSSTSGIPITSNGSSSNPSFGKATVPGGGTGITSTNPYDPLCGGTSTTGALQSLSAGTQLSLLTYNSSSSLPTWSPPAGIVLISQQVVSNVSSVVFDDTTITSTYNNYLLVINSVADPSSAGTCPITLSTNNGSSYIATGYQTGRLLNSYNQNTWSNTHNTTSFLSPLIQVASTLTAMYIYMFDLTNGTTPSAIGMGLEGVVTQVNFGKYTSNITVNNIKMVPNLSHLSGTFTLYGLLNG